MAQENQSAGDKAPLERVTFEINEVNSPEAAQAVRDAVKDLNGVRDVQFVGAGALVSFNPLGVTKEEICTAIRAERLSGDGNRNRSLILISLGSEDRPSNEVEEDRSAGVGWM